MFRYLCTIEFDDGNFIQFDFIEESLAQAEEVALLRAIGEELWSFLYVGRTRTVTDICVVKKEEWIVKKAFIKRTVREAYASFAAIAERGWRK